MRLNKLASASQIACAQQNFDFSILQYTTLIQVYVDFIARLKSDFPKLTQKEIRICMLTRLNAGSDEIINLLGISKNTIKSSRYRIHQKLNLEKGTKLYDFIARY